MNETERFAWRRVVPFRLIGSGHKRLYRRTKGRRERRSGGTCRRFLRCLAASKKCNRDSKTNAWTIIYVRRQPAITLLAVVAPLVSLSDIKPLLQQLAQKHDEAHSTKLQHRQLLRMAKK
uniref:Uncharacterized protein n=1 Tax=Plectus sambesii TaxID=2011161 RepID=A0A914X8N7_9BILA